MATGHLTKSACIRVHAAMWAFGSSPGLAVPKRTYDGLHAGDGQVAVRVDAVAAPSQPGWSLFALNLPVHIHEVGTPLLGTGRRCLHALVLEIGRTCQQRGQCSLRQPKASSVLLVISLPSLLSWHCTNRRDPGPA